MGFDGTQAVAIPKLSIANALVAAREDTELRFREFVEKFSLEDSTQKRQRDDEWDPNKVSNAAKKREAQQAAKKAADRAAAKAAGRGGAGNGAKGNGGKNNGVKGNGGKGNGWKGQKGAKGQTKDGVFIPAGITLKANTNNGKQICFGYSKGNCPGAATCHKEHVCQICEGIHTWKDCSKLH